MAHSGASFERTVANQYRREGWTTIRAYASLGIWDLMAFRKLQDKWEQGAYHYCTEVLAIQVKGRETDPFTDEEKATLKTFAEGFGGKAIYAYGKRMPLKKPIGRRRLQNHRTVIREQL